MNIAGRLIPAVVALGLIPVLISLMGLARFGILSLAWAVVGYMGLLELGIGRSLTHLVASRMGHETRDKLRHTISTAFVLLLVAGLTGAGALWVISPYAVLRLLTLEPGMSSETVVFARLVAATLPLVFVASGLRGVLEAESRFDLVNAVRIPTLTGMFVAAWIAVLVSPGLVGQGIALLVVRIASVVGYLIVARFGSAWMLEGHLSFSMGDAVPIASFGSWVSVSNALSSVLTYSDRLLLAGVLSATTLGVYSAAFEMTARLSLFPVAAAAVLFPTFAAGHSRDSPRSLAVLAKSSLIGAILMGVAATAYAVVAPIIFRLWLRESFDTLSVGVAQILAIGAFANGVAQAPFTYVQGTGRPRMAAFVHLVETPLYVVGLVWAVSSYGAMGAASAWSIRMVIDLGLMIGVCGWLERSLPADFWFVGLASVGVGVTILLTYSADDAGQAVAAVLPAVLALTAATGALRRSADTG